MFRAREVKLVEQNDRWDTLEVKEQVLCIESLVGSHGFTRGGEHLFVVSLTDGWRVALVPVLASQIYEKVESRAHLL